MKYKELSKEQRDKKKARNKIWWKKYCEKYPQKAKEIVRRKNFSRRIRVMQKISNNKIISCENCGCNIEKLLEINHKHGGGRKEMRNYKPTIFYSNILKSKRKTDDLNVLCKICNILHYCELKYGKLPYKIMFIKN
mgnify:CR=1 FL=1